MSKTYTIADYDDLSKVFLRLKNYEHKLADAGKEFQKLSVTVKAWREPKTTAQHNAYWVCISEAQKAFRQQGMVYTQDQLHNFFKIASGYCDTVGIGKDVIRIPKSIANNSSDATKTALVELISFILDFCLDNLNYTINIE